MGADNQSLVTAPPPPSPAPPTLVLVLNQSRSLRVSRSVSRVVLYSSSRSLNCGRGGRGGIGGGVVGWACTHITGGGDVVQYGVDGLLRVVPRHGSLDVRQELTVAGHHGLVVALATNKTVWCEVVWCGVVWSGVKWCGVEWCGVVWCEVVWCEVVWCGVVWSGVVWCEVVWCGVV